MPKSTSRVVIGQNVVCRSTSRIGQVLGVASPSAVCTVRFNDTGEVATKPVEDLRVATWDELRALVGKAKKDEDPTRIMPRLRTDVPDQQ
ncbi:MAG: hypothetical protein IPK87_04220 [Planctomycetes bacterium]|nr:hypothetical protein [Planctomycetota bacterium]